MPNKLYKSFFPLYLLFIFLSKASVAQMDSSSYLSNKLLTYKWNHFQERLFVHTDKTFYVVGENLWMKLYLTDALLHKPSNLSKLVYIELLNKNNESVLRTKIQMDGGYGNGSIKIPSAFLSGNYTLRAYTQWMRNEGVACFFEQMLTIVNTLNESAKSPNYSIIPKVDFQFFPEGGNLIAGVENKVAFKALNAYEKGIDCKGFVLNMNNDTVVKFSSFKLGMGNFKFKPLINESYKVILYTNDTVINIAIPKIQTFGYNMQLVDSGKEDLNIQINKVGSSPEEKLYLLIHGSQFAGKAITQITKSGFANINISKADLMYGVNKITIFNSDLKPVCERSYFNNPKDRLSINVKPNKEIYNKRSEVLLDLNALAATSRNEDVNMSMSVFLVDSIQAPYTLQDIESYMLLSSELKGYVESPGLYFDSTKMTALEKYKAIDNLMLTQGWTSYNWQDILGPTKAILHLPELEGQLVRAKILYKNTGLPANQVLTYFSIPGKPFYFASAKSNHNGDLCFNLRTTIGASEAILQAKSNSDSNYRISIIDPFDNSFSNRNTPPFALPNNFKIDLLNRSISSQVENIFESQLDKPSANIDTLPFFGQPSNTYYLDAYTRFTSMEELTKEYLKEIKIKQKGSDYSIFLWNNRFQLYNDRQPFILIDGVPIFNTNKLFSFDPLKIYKIDVLTETNLTGNVFSNGLLSYITYQGDLAGFPIDANALVVEYEGAQNAKKFYSPAYNTKQSQNSSTPDFRNLLHWDPMISYKSGLEQKIRFYTSDLSGRYAIVIQGLSSNGLMGSSIKFISVK